MKSDKTPNNLSPLATPEDPMCPFLRTLLADLLAQKQILDATIAGTQQALQDRGCNSSGGGAG